jgi:hypothetical protein
MTKIARIDVDWMEGYANSPRIIIDVGRWPERKEYGHLPYEKRGNAHRRDHSGIFSDYFFTDGLPCRGFGGAIFKGTLLDGTPFEYKGAWLGRAAAINKLWPESPVVDVVSEHYACHACRLDALLDAYDHLKPDFGLACVDDGDHAPILEPTRGGLLKPASITPKTKLLAHYTGERMGFINLFHRKRV